MTPEPFPPEISDVLDRALADRDHYAELDAQGRFVRGVYAGMTPAEVIAERDAYRRMVGE